MSVLFKAREQARVDTQFHSFGLAGCQLETVKADQAHRPGAVDRCQIDLRNVRARPIADVGHLESDAQCLASADFEILVFKPRIGQTETEWKQRLLIVAIQPAVSDESSFGMRRVEEFTFRPAPSWDLRTGILRDRGREGHRQAPGWIHLAEKHIGYGVRAS